MPPMPSLLRQPSHRPAFSLQRSRSAAVLLAASLLFILPAQAGSPAGSTDEPAHIAALREQARQLRDTAEARFRAAEPACYERFLVNRCLDQAREARLADIARARALEIEASQLTLARKQRTFLERHGEPATAARPPTAPPFPHRLRCPNPPTTARLKPSAPPAKPPPAVPKQNNAPGRRRSTPNAPKHASAPKPPQPNARNGPHETGNATTNDCANTPPRPNKTPSPPPQAHLRTACADVSFGLQRTKITLDAGGVDDGDLDMVLRPKTCSLIQFVGLRKR